MAAFPVAVSRIDTPADVAPVKSPLALFNVAPAECSDL
ncbi:hypothetical protein [Escherichia coli IS25]|nr:hypothetical protein [Escherichia coli IS25]